MQEVAHKSSPIGGGGPRPQAVVEGVPADGRVSPVFKPRR
ncbi:MAG: hypothetical protein JWR84_3011 [Caulobacter sp.]|nr:hypothetical protein [Caulobacter sp.]